MFLGDFFELWLSKLLASCLNCSFYLLLLSLFDHLMDKAKVVIGLGQFLINYMKRICDR